MNQSARSNEIIKLYYLLLCLNCYSSTERTKRFAYTWNKMKLCFNNDKYNFVVRATKNMPLNNTKLKKDVRWGFYNQVFVQHLELVLLSCSFIRSKMKDFTVGKKLPFTIFRKNYSKKRPQINFAWPVLVVCISFGQVFTKIT